MQGELRFGPGRDCTVLWEDSTGRDRTVLPEGGGGWDCIVLSEDSAGRARTVLLEDGAAAEVGRLPMAVKRVLSRVGAGHGGGCCFHGRLSGLFS